MWGGSGGQDWALILIIRPTNISKVFAELCCLPFAGGIVGKHSTTVLYLHLKQYLARETLLALSVRFSFLRLPRAGSTDRHVPVHGQELCQGVHLPLIGCRQEVFRQEMTSECMFAPDWS